MSIRNGDEMERDFLHFVISERTAMILERYHKEKSAVQEKEDQPEGELDEMLDLLLVRYLSEKGQSGEFQNLIEKIRECMEGMCSEQGQREEYAYEKGFEDGVKVSRAIWGHFGDCKWNV